MNKRSLKEDVNWQEGQIESFNQESNENEPEEYSFRVGNITSQGVTLVDNDYNMIHLPYSMLPIGSKSGSIISITIRRDLQQQQKQTHQLNQLVRRLQTGSNDHIVNDQDKDNSIDHNEQLKDQQMKRQKAKPQIQGLMKKKQAVSIHEQSKINTKQAITMSSLVGKKHQNNLNKLK